MESRPKHPSESRSEWQPECARVIGSAEEMHSMSIRRELVLPQRRPYPATPDKEADLR